MYHGLKRWGDVDVAKEMEQSRTAASPAALCQVGFGRGRDSHGLGCFRSGYLSVWSGDFGGVRRLDG